jgi:uncharacterized membrane protein (DUF485 family)
MAPPHQDDLTPISGSATDVAPTGRTSTKPAHELTAAEDGDPMRWSAIADSAEFKSLVRAKLRFIVPTTAFFFVYYLSLPILCGYCPDLMKKEIWGHVNVAYLFGLSQFLMAWVLAAIYVKVAGGWDRLAASLLQRFVK